jgi:hypothetical protein
MLLFAALMTSGLVLAALVRWGAPPEEDAETAPGEISVLTLVREMVDLDRLAERAAPPYRAGQIASTDRRSRSPSEGDTWFANDDFVTDSRPNLVRIEDLADGGRRYVLFDEAGPGAIVRIWSATPTGTLRIYIDGDEEPALEASMADLLSGAFPPFIAPFGHLAARGYSLYFPFPYRRRCLVTVDTIVSNDPFSGQPMAKLYYQIGYRRYRDDQSANVRSYSYEELQRARGSLRKVGTVLRDGPLEDARGAATQIAKTPIERGRPLRTVIAAPPGGGRITRLRLETDEREPGKLRSTVLSIRFDGQQTVRVPLIDFFGTGPAWAPYRSLPFSVEGSGVLVCRFRMPFRERVELEISREGGGTIELGGSVDVEPKPFGPGTLLFHAGWRPRQTLRTRPYSDHHLGTIEGEGHLVGTVLNVENPAGVAWWGEGDEKIYFEGEPFPRFFGTGAEDYFGYAWSTTETFAEAYHAQTRAGSGGFGGAFSMNRFHVLDPLPFERSLRFDFEVWHWSDTTVALDAVLYWYARPGATDDLPR